MDVNYASSQFEGCAVIRYCSYGTHYIASKMAIITRKSISKDCDDQFL